MSQSSSTPSQGDTHERMALIDGLSVVADLVREGLPLVAWEVTAYDGRVRASGRVDREKRGAGGPAVVTIVGWYAQHWTVPVKEFRRDGYRYLSTFFNVRGIELEVWGVVYDDEVTR